MSFTLATLKTAVQDYLQVSETTFTSQLDNFIQESESRIFKMVQLPEQRKNVQGSATSGNRFLATPTDFFAPFSLAVISSNKYIYLDFKHPSFLKEYSPDSTTTGTPKYYSLFDDSAFELSPVPNANFTVELHYFYEPESITVASSGTSWIGSNAENALLYGCLIEAYTYIKGEPDLMQLYQVRYESAMQELIALGEGYSTTDSYRAGSVRSDR